MRTDPATVRIRAKRLLMMAPLGFALIFIAIVAKIWWLGTATTLLWVWGGTLYTLYTRRR
jgi:hypothetical protein